MGMERLLLFFVLLLAFLALWPESTHAETIPTESVSRDEFVHVALVICGDTAYEHATTLIKSILYTTVHPLIHFHIHYNDDNRIKMKNFLQSTYHAQNHLGLQFTMYEIVEHSYWTNVFKPCASQRLFLQNSMPDLEKVIYFDIDIVVLLDIVNVWAEFKKFKPETLQALTVEHIRGKHDSFGWYNRHARHPWYGDKGDNEALGLNSGVILMDLNKMRQVRHQEEIVKLSEKWSKAVVWGDQCYLNIYYAKYPERVQILPCNYNFRLDFCQYGWLVCDEVRTMGIAIIHGNRGAFHKDAWPYRSVYRAFKSINTKWPPFPATLDVLVLESLRYDNDDRGIGPQERAMRHCEDLLFQYIYDVLRSTEYHIEQNDPKRLSPTPARTKSAEQHSTPYVPRTKQHFDDVLQLPAVIHWAVTVTNANRNPSYGDNFRTLLKTVVKAMDRDQPSTLHLHLMVDEVSRKILEDIVGPNVKGIKRTFYILNNEREKIDKKIVHNLRAIFGSEKFNDIAFYLPPLFPRIISKSITHLIVTDTDMIFRTDISQLYSMFESFTDTQVIGIAHEQQPVYHNVFAMHRVDNKDNEAQRLGVSAREGGFPGYNSGVMLMRLDRLRELTVWKDMLEGNTVKTLADIFQFRGHHGDQDLYTLLGSIHPELFYILPCNWNKQLCTWWRDVGGYKDPIFGYYYECEGYLHVVHGNCNTAIPDELNPLKNRKRHSGDDL
eukprot:CFRG8433T1